MCLLNKNKKVRILLANPESDNFKKRVFLEEQYIKIMSESRILFEWKSCIANLKDILNRVKNKDMLKIRIYDVKTEFTRIMIDNKEILNNIYGKKKGEYGASKPSRIITKYLDNKFFDILKNEFDQIWEKSEEFDFEKYDYNS